MGHLGDGLKRDEISRWRKKERRHHEWYGEGWWCCFTGVSSTVQGGPLSLPAPLNPSHLLRPWIRHTPVSPQPAAEFALSSVMHVCPLVPAFSYPCFHPPFLSLSECQGFQQCLGQDGQTVLQQTCFHTCSTSSLAHTCVSLALSLSAYFACQSHLRQRLIIV